MLRTLYLPTPQKQKVGQTKSRFWSRSIDIELSEHELECKEQHLQLAMDTVLRLVDQVKTLQDEVAQLKKT